MNPYATLGVAPGDSPDQVRLAYRKFAARHHPDHGGDAGTFRIGLDAYRMLANITEPARVPGQITTHRRRRGLAFLSEVWHRRHSPGRVI